MNLFKIISIVGLFFVSEVPTTKQPEIHKPLKERIYKPINLDLSTEHIFDKWQNMIKKSGVKSTDKKD